MDENEKIKINEELKSDHLSDIIDENFIKLSEGTQTNLINTLKDLRDKEGGVLGRLFGTNKDSAAMHIAFTICVLLVVVGIICTWTGQDKWDTIIAGIMTTVGYIFGRNSKN